MLVNNKKHSDVVEKYGYYKMKIIKSSLLFVSIIIILLLIITSGIYILLDVKNYEISSILEKADMKNLISIISAICSIAAVIVVWTQLQQMNSSAYIDLVDLVKKHHGKKISKLRKNINKYYNEYIFKVVGDKKIDCTDTELLEELIQNCRDKFKTSIDDDPYILEKCKELFSEVANYYEYISMFIDIGWADMHPTNRALLLNMLHNSSIKVAASLLILMPVLRGGAHDKYWLNSFRKVLPKLIVYRRQRGLSTNSIDLLVNFLINKEEKSKPILTKNVTEPKPVVGILGLGRVGKSTLSMVDQSRVSKIVIFDTKIKYVDMYYDTEFKFVESAEEIFQCCDIIFACIPSDQLEVYINDPSLTQYFGSILFVKRSSSSYNFSNGAKKIFSHYVSFPCFMEYKQYCNVEDTLLLGGCETDVEKIQKILRARPSRQVIIMRSAESADQCKMAKFAIDHSLLVLWNEIFEWLNTAGAEQSDIESFMQFLYFQKSMSTCIRVPCGGNANENLQMFENFWSSERGMNITKLALKLDKKFSRKVGLSAFRFPMLQEGENLSPKALAAIRAGFEKFKN
ncbi:NAD(P)-binding domain-containing protein [Geobacter sp. AOG2]|uniref:NAD(P)-binding domain-containing protein n=1 Tax=Geobacter sp. AOG2 TaxID=1566347 RepID=UPI001CC4657B|nr:NAD(P)-binding domain-containing protein [Geobacter sp. AOG2]GFE62738.1 hypothetical protein AOG2_33260 [Geobacter sp. AOG2]